MITIQIDWSTAAAIIGSGATLAGFLYGIIKSKSKNEDNVDIKKFDALKEKANKSDQRLDDFEKALRMQREDIKSVSNVADDLDRAISEQNGDIKVLEQVIDDIKEEKRAEQKDYIDKLARIENRLEKMIDMIMNLNVRG